MAEYSHGPDQESKDQQEENPDILTRLGRLSDEDWREIENAAVTGVKKTQYEIVLPIMIVAFVVSAIAIVAMTAMSSSSS